MIGITPAVLDILIRENAGKESATYVAMTSVLKAIRAQAEAETELANLRVEQARADIELTKAKVENERASAERYRGEASSYRPR